MSARPAPWVLLALVLAHPASGAGGREDELARVREAIEESRERVARYESEQRGLLEALEALDRSLVLLKREVAHADARASEARARLREVEAEAAELAAALERTREAMRARSVALYKAGELGAVRLLFAAGGLREFLSRVAALRLLIGYDADLIRRHREQAAALAVAESEAREAAAERDEAAARLAERSGELDRERAAKQRVVARLHLDRRRERQALIELERAARALEETLAALGREDGGGGPLSGPGLAALKRRLPPPIEGGEVLQDFGVVVDDEFLTETFHKGLALRAARGTPVRSVAAASVRFAGWFRGYGRLVILDHGDDYFTVSGHLDEVEVDVGDRVPAGAVIGTLGDTGSLTGPQLYFEIRKGGEPLDPDEWLARLH